MRDEEARKLTLAVAEAIGWKEIFDRLGRTPFGWPPSLGVRCTANIPDYARSWDAMREVVGWINSQGSRIDLENWDVDSSWSFNVIPGAKATHTTIGNGYFADAPEAVCRAALALAERLKATPPSSPDPPSPAPSSE